METRELARDIIESNAPMTVAILLLLAALLFTFAFGLPHLAQQNLPDGNLSAALP